MNCSVEPGTESGQILFGVIIKGTPRAFVRSLGVAHRTTNLTPPFVFLTLSNGGSGKPARLSLNRGRFTT